MMKDANGEPSILIRYLERYTSYQYVLSATNDGGTTLGVPSRPWLTDVTEGSLRKAPHTETSGSASYTITWIGQASHCRPQLRWSIESKRKGAGTKWVSLAVDISASTYTTHNLRCPEGCAFRVTPTNIIGWSDEWVSYHNLIEPTSSAINAKAAAATAAASNSSIFLPSDFLPSLRPNAVRVELSFTRAAASSNNDDAQTARSIKTAIASAISVPSHRVAVVEVRGHGLYVVLDLLAPPASATSALSGTFPSAEQLATRLVDALLTDDSSLYKSSDGGIGTGMIATRFLDPRAGILRLSANGQSTSQLLSQAQLSQTTAMAAGIRAAADVSASKQEARVSSAAAVAARIKEFTVAAAAEEAAWWKAYGESHSGVIAMLSAPLAVVLVVVFLLGLMVRSGKSGPPRAPSYEALMSAPAAAAAATASWWASRRDAMPTTTGASWWASNSDRKGRAVHDSCKRVDFYAGAAIGTPGGGSWGVAASGHVDVADATSALDLLEMVASLAEELLDAPLSEQAILICVDSAGHEKTLTAAEDLSAARRAVSLRVVGPQRRAPMGGSRGGGGGGPRSGLFGGNRRAH